MTEVRAISFSQKDCGKHVSDTKKRFAWIFEIDGKSYTLELINSALSGKKTVLLNMEQIHHQKNILNIDFDFTYMIDGHSFRISRMEDKINSFEMRIDNRTFDEVKLGRHKTEKTGLTKKYSKVQTDPFSEFQNFTSNNTSTVSKSNDFGDFDFDSFSKPSNTQPVKIESQSIKNDNNNNISNLLDFAQVSKPNILPVNDFQTNAFQTNNQNGFNNFTNNFKQNQINLLDVDQNQFSTNAYVNRNYYLDLKSNQVNSDMYFGDNVTPPVAQNNNKNFWENFQENKQKAGLVKKKAINIAAMNFNQMKKNVKNIIQDLI